MLILHGSAAILRVTTDTGADCDVHADYVDHDFTTPGPTTETFRSGNQNSAITTATDTTVVSATGSSTVDRNIKRLSVYNIDITSQNVTVSHSINGSTFFKMAVVPLAAGEWLVIDDKGVIFAYDTNGAVKAGSVSASDTLAGIQANALQSDMESGSSTTLTVTPGRAQFHPSAAKCWLKAGLTGNILGSYNITSLTDTGTGVLTVTIATDFSSTQYAALATIEFTSTTLAQSCTVDSVAAGSIVLRSVVEAGSSADPVTWSFAGFGDQ